MPNTALLLIDLQNDYFPGGAMELAGAEAAVENARLVLERCRQRGLHIIHIQHIASKPDATFFRPGTPGAEIHPKAAPAADEVLFQKHYPNGFRDTLLLDHLKEHRIASLVVVGMMTHMCVDTTVRAAFDLGFAVTLIHDACATRDLSFGAETIPARSVHHAFMAALHGMFAQTVDTADFLAH